MTISFRQTGPETPVKIMNITKTTAKYRLVNKDSDEPLTEWLPISVRLTDQGLIHLNGPIDVDDSMRVELILKFGEKAGPFGTVTVFHETEG